MDGTLLFREDFGGNNPDDPTVSTTPLTSMSSDYSQATNPEYKGDANDMGSGKYILTKEGYRNSSNNDYSVWHIMDDHTYPNDKTRGYCLEIDGHGTGNDVFFSTTMEGLCAGSRLTFSAYVANLTTAGQYEAWKNNRPYTFPNLSFIIINPATGTQLARYETGNIDHDYENYPKSWRESANWQLVGLTFTVTLGIDKVELRICNNANGSATGNDFAIDDIEVHFCYPEGEILGEPSVCTGSPTKLEATWEATGDMVEPLEFKWWYSSDSLTWTEISGVSGFTLSIPSVQAGNFGWYKAAMSEVGNIERVNCRTLTKPFKLTDKQCTPPVEEPDLCMDGTLLFREDFGGNNPDDPRIGTDPVDGMTYDQLLDDYFGIMHSGAYLLTKQGYCNGDTSVNNLPQNRGSQWHLQDDHTYPDDVSRGYLLEIDGAKDNKSFYTKTIDNLCPGTQLTFSAYVANIVTWNHYTGRDDFAYPNLKFVITDPVNNAELASYETGDIPYDASFEGDYKCWQQSVEWHLVGMNFTVPDGVSSVKLTIYNNVDNSIGNDFAIDDIEIRLCIPPIDITGSHQVCEEDPAELKADFNNNGALQNPEYQWFFSPDGTNYSDIDDAKTQTLSIPAARQSDAGWYTVSVAEQGQIGSENCQRLSEPFYINVEDCTVPPPPCPEIIKAPIDTTVCDTLLPFTWRGVLFTEPATKDTILQNQQGCDSIELTLTLDTAHCERPVSLYPILVNKYDWVLLVDNKAVRRFFPDKEPIAYIWYHNDQLIEDANEDDYSTEQRLEGTYQVFLLFADSSQIGSNIIEILPPETPQPTLISVYNYNGRLIRHWITHNLSEPFTLPKGIYLIRFEQAGEVTTKKLLIP